MEEKNNKVLIWLIIILVLSLVGYIVYDNFLKIDKTNPNYDNNSTTTTTTNLTSNINKGNEENRDEKEDFVLSFDNENPDGTKSNFYSLIETLNGFSDTTNIKDIIINGIKLEGKTHLIKIKNFNPNDPYDCVKGTDKVLYFDEKVLYEPENEACYLSNISKIIVLDEKYLVIHYAAQNGGFVIIVDKSGNEIPMENNIIVSSINFINNDSIYFEGWKADEDCYSNLYKLNIVDNKVQINLIDESNNMLCF